LALEAARGRRDGVEVVRLCAGHRVLRQQAFEPPALQHFLLFGLVTGVRTESDHRSEVKAMGEHVRSHLAIVQAARELGAAVGQTVVRISDTVVHAALKRPGVAIEADVSCPHDAIPPTWLADWADGSVVWNWRPRRCNAGTPNGAGSTALPSSRIPYVFISRR
jgi:hypothetical protein